MEYRQHTTEEKDHVLKISGRGWTLKCRICGKGFVNIEKFEALKEEMRKTVEECSMYKKCQRLLKVHSFKDD